MPIVYVLTNECMPDLVKIGRTDNSIIKRMKELDQTGVAFSFECYYALERGQEELILRPDDYETIPKKKFKN